MQNDSPKHNNAMYCSSLLAVDLLNTLQQLLEMFLKCQQLRALRRRICVFPSFDGVLPLLSVLLRCLFCLLFLTLHLLGVGILVGVRDVWQHCVVEPLLRFLCHDVVTKVGLEDRNRRVRHAAPNCMPDGLDRDARERWTRREPRPCGPECHLQPCSRTHRDEISHVALAHVPTLHEVVEGEEERGGGLVAVLFECLDGVREAVLRMTLEAERQGGTIKNSLSSSVGDHVVCLVHWDIRVDGHVHHGEEALAHMIWGHLGEVEDILIFGSFNPVNHVGECCCVTQLGPPHGRGIQVGGRVLWSGTTAGRSPQDSAETAVSKEGIDDDGVQLFHGVTAPAILG
mmetsp:Transcript_26472/g.69587  ORF Transcript_26472/g.69587 Transcript_26472/m.69587 type:complete len:342 (-) Transcript_26472:1988-3013(-)